jgi:hypothetical protein
MKGTMTMGRSSKPGALSSAVFAVTALATIAGLAARGTVRASEEPREGSYVGEVVDLHCYVTRGARGAEHAGCANACIARGVTPGLVTADGKAYLLLGEKPFSPKDTLAGRAGATVTVRGTLVERGGMSALQVRSIEAAPAAP